MITPLTKCPRPNSQLVELIASALGEPAKLTYRRGRKVQEFIFQFFEINAYENRDSAHVIAARIAAAGEVLETLCVDQTSKYITQNPGKVPRFMPSIDWVQRLLDSIRGTCETALENAKTKAPELAGAGL
jgi:hypothetical protein